MKSIYYLPVTLLSMLIACGGEKEFTLEGKDLAQIHFHSTEQLNVELSNIQEESTRLDENISEEEINYCLEKVNRCLFIPELEVLSKEDAKLLASWPGERIYLNSLTELDTEAAWELSQWQGQQVHLSKVQASQDVSNEMKDFKGITKFNK